MYMFEFMMLPGAVLVASALLGTMVKIPKSAEAVLQHFAGGVVLSAVASELVPEMKKEEAPVWAITVGFLLGVAMLLTIRKIFSEKEEADEKPSASFQKLDESGSIPWGSVIPTLIDLLCDGMLVGLSFSAGAGAGFILAISIALEMASLGAALVVKMQNEGVTTAKAILVVVVLSAAMVAAGVGSFAVADSIQGTPSYYAALAFGIAACLWLACEDLLLEAHEEEGEKWFVTAMFFVGFLVPIILDKVGGE